MKKRTIARLPRHSRPAGRARLRDRDEVVNLQGDAETIETGAEIRSGGGNAHRDLLLFQRKSPDNVGERTMAAVILARAVRAARTVRRRE